MSDIENKAAGSSANNTPSQTLFRFVSLRSPQQSDDKEQDKRFILAPNELKDSHFYRHVLQSPGIPKKQALEAYAREYVQMQECIKDKDYFKNSFTELYNFAVDIARNKENFSNQELEEKAHQMRDFIKKNGLEQTLLFWNNLIYQVVTQKDFYIKETLMQILVAIHVAMNFDPSKSSILINARVVLPKDLMIDNPDAFPIGSAARMAEKEEEEEGEVTSPSSYMEKQQKIQEAKALLDRYEILQKELSLIEKSYTKEYQQAYQDENERYQEMIKPIMDEYDAKVEDSKMKFCEIRKPDQPYNPEDPCQQPEKIPHPELPKFDFSYRPEVDGRTLVNSLKPATIDTVLSLLDYDFLEKAPEKRIDNAEVINTLLAGRNTFSEVKELISSATQKANRIILDNVVDNAESYTSIGGVILPVSRVETIPFTYQLCPRFILRNTCLDLSLDVPDSSWDVASMSYTFYTNAGPISGTYFEKSRVGNKIFLNKLLGSATTDGVYISQTENFTMDVKITFTNGKVTTFHPKILTMKSCYSSGFEFINEIKDPVVEDDSFIPSGFGFKQIGIADYLKVEQTTHAYVEGEVAHIENVMAREYREKATRRLRRSENTTTTSSDTEREKLTDTTTATRFEMQTEIAKMMQEARDVNMQTHFDASWKTGTGPMSATLNTGIAGGYANHTSKEESTRQAMTQAQDVTARALDRVVTKVHEERIEKIIEEFEENNKHGFDNTKGDKHVVGVFRWVDKLLKNQIYNYGKRLMFEFMIPQPAKLHTLGMTLDKSATKSDLVKPEDPRKSSDLTMVNYTSLDNEAILKHWAGKYNVEIEIPLKNMVLSKSYSETNIGDNEYYNKTESVTIPDGYIATHAYANGYFKYDGDGRQYHSYGVAIGQHVHCISERRYDGYIANVYFNLENVSNSINVSYHATNYHAMSIGVNIHCVLSDEAKKTWQQKTFKAIIDGYEKALAIYEQKVAEEKANGIEIKGSNPGFYRQIENTVLRKNCISYMINRTANSTHGYGMAGLTTGSTFTDYETDLSPKLDKYTAFLKFMEQAFEWENLSYYLYPYYWANKTEWTSLYQSEDVDPLFRAFLQSGMARVIVTVRPGFEDAVQFYMATGKIWNGGEVPVIGDPLYLSIVDEMKEPKGVKQGKAWITRLPTPLNILQAESIGLKVQHALPFTVEDPNEFEVPGEVITDSNFIKDESLLGNASSEKWIQLTWNGMDSIAYATIGDLDMQGVFPRVYEFQEKSITIDRDASWQKTDSTIKFYEEMAYEISKTDGIEAFPSDSLGLRLRIDVNKIKKFKLCKPIVSGDDDFLEFTTDGSSYLKFSNGLSQYGIERILDRSGNKLTGEDFLEKAPLKKFLL
ncbi:hypothetical protein ABXT08_01770 [Chryseobacterium sp. NRRL B-14859]|uniref:hypothetical protein n=1 Tax=Chryseobacterium sp. NRRL B-14859 TaxID=1562763 RepID=UPI003399EC37